MSPLDFVVCGFRSSVCLCSASFDCCERVNVESKAI